MARCRKSKGSHRSLFRDCYCVRLTNVDRALSEGDLVSSLRTMGCNVYKVMKPWKEADRATAFFWTLEEAKVAESLSGSPKMELYAWEKREWARLQQDAHNVDPLPITADNTPCPDFTCASESECKHKVDVAQLETKKVRSRHQGHHTLELVRVLTQKLCKAEEEVARMKQNVQSDKAEKVLVRLRWQSAISRVVASTREARLKDSLCSLREANAALVTEPQDLRVQVETLKQWTSAEPTHPEGSAMQELTSITHESDEESILKHEREELHKARSRTFEMMNQDTHQAISLMSFCDRVLQQRRQGREAQMEGPNAAESTLRWIREKVYSMAERASGEADHLLQDLQALAHVCGVEHTACKSHLLEQELLKRRALHDQEVTAALEHAKEFQHSLLPPDVPLCHRDIQAIPRLQFPAPREEDLLLPALLPSSLSARLSDEGDSDPGSWTPTTASTAPFAEVPMQQPDLRPATGSSSRALCRASSDFHVVGSMRVQQPQQPVRWVARTVPVAGLMARPPISIQPPGTQSIVWWYNTSGQPVARSVVVSPYVRF